MTVTKLWGKIFNVWKKLWFFICLINHCVFSFYYFPDTRVKGWFLLDNYIPTFICSVIYLLIVWLGPKYMKNRQPFSCRRILVVYNLGLTLLSLYMFCEVGLFLKCVPVAVLNCVPKWRRAVCRGWDGCTWRSNTWLHFEYVLKLIFQNARVVQICLLEHLK